MVRCAAGGCQRLADISLYPEAHRLVMCHITMETAQSNPELGGMWTQSGGALDQSGATP
jgi:hypothetical protein